MTVNPLEQDRQDLIDALKALIEKLEADPNRADLLEIAQSPFVKMALRRLDGEAEAKKKREAEKMRKDVRDELRREEIEAANNAMQQVQHELVRKFMIRQQDLEHQSKYIIPKEDWAK